MAEKSLPYELIEINLKNKPKELWKLNPYGKVPVLVDGADVIYESAIINEYLDEKFAQVPLMPRDPAKRATARIWIDFCNTRLQAAGSDIAHGRDPERAKEKFHQYLVTLNEQMRTRKYIAGGYSLADVTFAPVFLRQQRYGIEIDQRLPHLKRWMDVLLARPAVCSTIERQSTTD